MQVIALVAGAVLGAVALLSVFGVRSATVQFRATVQENRVGPAAAPDVPLEALVAFGRDSGIAALTARVASGDTAVLGAAAVMVVGPAGTLLATSDTSYRGAAVTRRGIDGIALEVRRAGELRRLVLDGGRWIPGAAGDTLALVIPIPRPMPDTHVAVSVDSASRAFGAGFNRQLWLGAAAIILLAIGAATSLTRRLLEPLARLRAAADRVATGDYTARVGRTGMSELDPVAAAFDGMAESLSRSEGSRRQLLRDVAHELRTPLTNLRAQVESLQDGLRPADAAAMASLQEEVHLLERLVADVDVLARADAGRLEMERRRLDLAELARRSAVAFVSAGRLPADRLILDLHPADVVGDPARLGQLVRNLVENAVLHGGAGVVVTIRCARNGDSADLEVRDTGPGIAPEHLPHVFDRLYRPDPSRTRKSGGSGLGLSIVKAIVEGHGGAVTLSSPPGQGTTVRVSLPVHPAGESS